MSYLLNSFLGRDFCETNWYLKKRRLCSRFRPEYAGFASSVFAEDGFRALGYYITDEDVAMDVGVENKVLEDFRGGTLGKRGAFDTGSSSCKQAKTLAGASPSESSSGDDAMNFNFTLVLSLDDALLGEVAGPSQPSTTQ